MFVKVVVAPKSLPAKKTGLIISIYLIFVARPDFCNFIVLSDNFPDAAACVISCVYSLFPRFSSDVGLKPNLYKSRPDPHGYTRFTDLGTSMHT